MTTTTLADLDAVAAVRRIRAGEITSEALIRDCLERIADREGGVEAWTFLDPELALEQARQRDRQQRRGESLGLLHGVPVGVKDIIDTGDMPTECGSAVFAGRRPTRDATVVSRLREQGAVILGKTVTTEFATYCPGKTRNPLDPSRTPGGSSSGSAAAVACRMVPLALGTQTNGSIVRPAAFCGVVGYKPSFGFVSRAGVLLTSRGLDQVGVFAGTVDDAALLAEVIAGQDACDPTTRAVARPWLTAVAQQPPPVTPPRLAFVKTPIWDQADEETREHFEGLCRRLGTGVEECPLPEPFDGALAQHRVMMETDIACNLGAIADAAPQALSDSLRAQIERGRSAYTSLDYAAAVAAVPSLRESLGPLFATHDAILTPAAPGPAPVGLESTGSPAFCTLWTLLGLPALSLPLLAAGNGMPIGVQLVGRYGDDAGLLRTASWLLRTASAA